jgi:hypothetical protein
MSKFTQKVFFEINSWVGSGSTDKYQTSLKLKREKHLMLQVFFFQFFFLFPRGPGKQSRALVPIKPFQTSLLFADKEEAYPCKAL